MSATKTKDPDAWAWLTKAQAAAVAGYEVRNFSDKIQPRLPVTAMRGKGATLRFDAREVGKALAAHITELSRPKPEDIDPLLGADGETSDALEAYRREATIEKQLKNAATRRELIEKRKVMEALSAGFAAAADMGRKLAVRYDATAGVMFNQAIEAMRRGAKAAFGEDVKMAAVETNDVDAGE